MRGVFFRRAELGLGRGGRRFSQFLPEGAATLSLGDSEFTLAVEARLISIDG
jgi:hypothetical protein